MFALILIAVRRLRFENQIYSYYFERMTHPEAMLRCSPSQQNGDRSSRLLVIDRPEIQRAVETHLNTIGFIRSSTRWESRLAPGYWIGGRDVVVEGDWRWSDLRRTVIPTLPGQLGYQNWYRQAGRNEPRGTPPGEDCLYVNAIFNLDGFPNILGSWFSSVCFVRKFFICQADAPSKFKRWQ